MKKAALHLHFRSKLMMVQFFLVVPLITIVIFVFVYLTRSSVMAELDNSRAYSLQTAGGAFDTAYLRALKTLEIPYTNRTIYEAISVGYDASEVLARSSDFSEIQSILYRDILYYEPNITSVAIVSEISGATYYSRKAPAIAPNMHNPDWYDLTGSAWFKNAVAVDEPVISQAAENDLFLGSGITLSFSQRLKDVLLNRRLGAIRVDLNLGTMTRDWQLIAENENDVFVVLDHMGDLVFASAPTFFEQNRVLSKPDVTLWQEIYRVSSYKAPKSGFEFFYLAHPSSSRLNARLLYGIPFIFAALSVIYSILFISRSSQYISRPVQKLKTAMQQGQQKDLSVRCERLDGEMGELSEAFNDLMDQVGELVGEVADKEKEKAQLAYEALRSKINPHFLYNTMNAIRWKADLLGAKEISHALESLASLLRFSIKSTHDTIPFSQELEQLENYVQIMRVRYGSDVDVCYDVDDRCESYQCLKFLFQPAVENCFIHAFSGSFEKPKSIFVRVFVEDARIRAEIEDNGSGMSAEQIKGLLEEESGRYKSMFAGIGIGNVRQRIRTLFGGEYGLKIESVPGAHTRVTATIPKIQTEEARNDNTAGR